MSGPVGLPSGPDKKWKVPFYAVAWLARFAWALIVSFGKELIGRKQSNETETTTTAHARPDE